MGGHLVGVSIERDQGEGRYVTVRGAPKEFTTVTIDGVNLANPDAESRGVELDTIPADGIAAEHSPADFVLPDSGRTNSGADTRLRFNTPESAS